MYLHYCKTNSINLLIQLILLVIGFVLKQNKKNSIFLSILVVNGLE